MSQSTMVFKVFAKHMFVGVLVVTKRTVLSPFTRDHLHAFTNLRRNLYLSDQKTTDAISELSRYRQLNLRRTL